MASKNSIKVNVKNGYYHVYNRGVEKRNIFESTQDYKVFLKYIKEYLSPPQKSDVLEKPFTVKDTVFKGMPRQPKNYNKKIILIAYSLMPNHLHLLLKQLAKNDMKDFLHSLLLRYSMYFNKKYDRVGPLFQGRYKAALITKDNYLLHLSRYIHLNPQKNHQDLTKAYSSYPNYLGQQKTSWVHPDIILKFFNNSVIPELTKINSYKSFVENYKKDSAEVLGTLTLEN